MDENPGGTPNPLNPNLEDTDRLVPEPNTTPTPVSTTTTAQTEPVQEVVTETTEIITETQPGDPMARPMEKAPVMDVQPVKKKKKTAIIVGSIIALFVLVGCAVAAILFILNNKGDAVAQAIDKLLNNPPENVSVDGTINIKTGIDDSPFSEINAVIKTDTMARSMINSSNIALSGTLQGGNDQIEVTIDEIYTPSGDLYLKLDGITNALEDYTTYQNIKNSNSDVELEATDESTTEVVGIDSVNMFSSTLEAIDGEWIRISNDVFQSALPDEDEESATACLVQFTKNINNSSNSFAKIYQDNPFITSTSENLSVASKLNPIYKLGIDEEKLTSFIDSASKTPVVTGLFDCLGYSEMTINAESLVKDLAKLPEVYVEIDGNHNITRLYFTVEEKSNDTIMTLDFSFSYPTAINVSEPLEYKDITTVTEEIFNTINNTETLPE